MIRNIIFIFPLLVVINGDVNCSVPQACGTYGYCMNATAKADAYCDCKFWWEGEFCNQQSDNGIEVIILGCLVGIVVFTFYGLTIGLRIQAKVKARQQKKKNDDVSQHTKLKSSDESQDPKLMNIAKEQFKKSTQLSSCIIAVLMVLLATAALVVKWVLIQPIHNELAEKSKDNLPVYFNRTSFCGAIEVLDFDILTFSVACGLVLLCIVITKRISFMRNKCHGYIGPPIPLDFLSHLNRKFAAVIFAIISDELLKIIKEMVGNTPYKDKGVLVKFLLRILQVCVMGFRFYPILIAVHINTILTLSCATLYAWLDYAFTIFTQGKCNPDYYPTYEDFVDGKNDVEFKFFYFGYGQALLAIQICTAIPKHLLLAYVSVKIPAMLIQKLLNRRKKVLSDEKKVLHSLTREEKILIDISQPGSVEMLYVENLFRSADKRPHSQALFARLIPKFIYEWRDDFRFSSRVLCIYSSIFLLLYFVIIQACVKIVPFLMVSRDLFQNLIDTGITLVDGISQAISNSSKPIELSFPVPYLVRPYLLAVAMTTTIIVIQLLVLLANIRRNLLQAYRGDDSEIPRRSRKLYVDYSTGNIHFAGYFIGYFIWGFIIIAGFSAVVCTCIEAFVSYGNVKIIEKALKAIIPSILIVLLKIYINKLLAQYVFLQHHGEVLSLNNRRFLMIFIYFNFFLDAFLGFVSSILRLVKSILGAIFYMTRLDYSSLGRKLETLDSGFAAYVGFIHTECAHRHPVMLVFASNLFNLLRIRQYELKHRNLNDLPTPEDVAKNKRALRWRRKWKLAGFLIKNPSIVFFRKSVLNQLHIDEVHALTNVDNNNRSHAQRQLAVYTRQMAAKRISMVSDMDSTYPIIQRF